MKTNRFYCIIMMFFVIFTTMLSISSCGNDDEIIPEKENDKEIEATSSIIGTWTSVEIKWHTAANKNEEKDRYVASFYARYTFDSDNTFTSFVYEEGKGYKTINGSWEYDKNNQKLRLTHNGITDTYSVKMEKDVLTLSRGNIIDTYNKEVTSAIVGTWKHSFKDGGYLLYTFYDDGTATFYEDEKGYGISKWSGFYKYDANDKCIYIIYIEKDYSNVRTLYLTWTSKDSFIEDDDTFIRQ